MHLVVTDLQMLLTSTKKKCNYGLIQRNKSKCVLLNTVAYIDVFIAAGA